MCGIVGSLNLNKSHPIAEDLLRQMLAMIRHRGPDQFGIYLDQYVGLGSARLSIIDLSGGQQPITNEDESLWIVFNGEIFNYVELRPGLEARGHRFITNSDTEVLLHLYEEHGPDCLRFLNGQFAIAIWDQKAQSLFLARDRLGIRPLFYTVREGALIFGSEIKAILAHPLVQAVIDPQSLDQIFTFWSTISPRTAFREIYQVPPGHWLLAKNGHVTIQSYWELQFPITGDGTQVEASRKSFNETLRDFRELLIDATQIRLRADVPVGAYLSGGLDSSVTSAIIRNYTDSHLDTFSITFENPEFDEGEFQQKMAQFLGTDHHIVHATHADIGRVFPEVIWHTEMPITRTAPVPMYLLSKLVRGNNYKVVMTGEGADEFLAGYDIFKEAKIRRFWARQPESKIRPLLLQELYPDISAMPSGLGYLTSFYGVGLQATAAPEYSHAVRWRTTSRSKRFFSDDLRQQLGSTEGTEDAVFYPPDYHCWDALSQAQYLEVTIFLSQYLLSSQGDRVAMANSVEGRYPFLDYRVVEFCNSIPAEWKLHGLTEKYLLRQLAKEWLPEEIWKRRKRPYRAPIHRSFFSESTPDFVRELLSQGGIASTGLFKPEAIAQMVNKVSQGNRLSETDDMALAGILSAQLVHQQFITDFKMPPPLSLMDDVKVCIR
jgi:asparagine synthase (glutamine-hydrolysing)